MDRLSQAARPEVQQAITALGEAIRRESQEACPEFDRRAVQAVAPPAH